MRHRLLALAVTMLMSAVPAASAFAQTAAPSRRPDVIYVPTPEAVVEAMLQVAAVFALIIWNPSPTWVDVLVYLAVLVTVVSGADYFFGLRRRVQEEREARTAAKTISVLPSSRRP